MGRYDDQKIYRTFEEFEREELRRDAGGGSFDELVDEIFAGELDFDSDRKGRKSRDEDDDEE